MKLVWLLLGTIFSCWFFCAVFSCWIFFFLFWLLVLVRTNFLPCFEVLLSSWNYFFLLELLLDIFFVYFKDYLSCWFDSVCVGTTFFCWFERAVWRGLRSSSGWADERHRELRQTWRPWNRRWRHLDLEKRGKVIKGDQTWQWNEKETLTSTEYGPWKRYAFIFKKTRKFMKQVNIHYKSFWNSNFQGKE